MSFEVYQLGRIVRFRDGNGTISFTGLGLALTVLLQEQLGLPWIAQSVVPGASQIVQLQAVDNVISRGLQHFAIDGQTGVLGKLHVPVLVSDTQSALQEFVEFQPSFDGCLSFRLFRTSGFRFFHAFEVISA